MLRIWIASLVLFRIGFHDGLTILVQYQLFAVYFHLASSGLEGFPLGHVKNYSYNFEEPVQTAILPMPQRARAASCACLSKAESSRLSLAYACTMSCL